MVLKGFDAIYRYATNGTGILFKWCAEGIPFDVGFWARNFLPLSSYMQIDQVFLESFEGCVLCLCQTFIVNSVL